jgi:hypothetical protein
VLFPDVAGKGAEREALRPMIGNILAELAVPVRCTYCTHLESVLGEEAKDEREPLGSQCRDPTVACRYGFDYCRRHCGLAVIFFVYFSLRWRAVPRVSCGRAIFCTGEWVAPILILEFFSRRFDRLRLQ